MMHISFRGVFAASLVLGLAACNGATDEATDDTDDTTTDECQSGITKFLPDRDATEVYYRTPIELTFSADESSATITLTDGTSDVAADVNFSGDGKIATITPSAALMPSTTYTLNISYSCGDVTSSFTTSNVGAAIMAGDSVGKTYNIDLASGRITQPAGVGDLLLGLLEGNPIDILVGPSEYDETAMTLAMIGALGARDGSAIIQDDCEQSIDFPVAADFSANPFFSIEGTNVDLAVAGVELTLARIEITGAFAPDMSEIVGVTLEGDADTRELDGLIDGVDDICATVAAVGVSCTACPDGEAKCLSIAADSIIAEEVAGVTLETITPEQAEANCPEE